MCRRRGRVVVRLLGGGVREVVLVRLVGGWWVDLQAGIWALLRSQSGAAGQPLPSPTVCASWLKYVEMNLESNGWAGTQPSYFGAASANGASAAAAIHSEKRMVDMVDMCERLF